MVGVFFSILLILLGVFIGIFIIFFINYIKGKKAIAKAEIIVESAKQEAEKLKRESILEAKDESHRIKQEAEELLKDSKQRVKETEQRLLNRENNIDRRDEMLQKKEQSLEKKDEDLSLKQKKVQEELDKVEDLKNEQVELLQNISGFSKQEAREIILKKTEEMMDLEINSYIKERESEAKLTADKKAKDMLISCMQRYASDVVNEQAVTVISLPSDDLKGRIIGREGRNIRTIEAVTGVDLIIDDTPEAIVISSFDPFRREIARLTLESLIKDGRIHPTRIEEVYDKMSDEMNIKKRELGQNALFELGITKMDSELIELLGKLNYRTSYGQNVLKHSMEVASLSGIIASEMDENINLAKRAGLLHDIGKAVDHELEGSHVTLGAMLAKKYHENDIVINAIESHHGDCNATSIIAAIVSIADALSASRPGARNDSLENYIKRLEDLENIANEISGVEKSYAVQAGRELRVIVKPEEIDDSKSYKIARTIKNKIESEMQYPGTIKVTVIREIRAVEEAK